MNAKAAALTLCALFVLAAVANAVDAENQDEEQVSTQSRAKANKLKEWIKARAEKFVAKLEKIVNKLKLDLPWDKKGKMKDGKPLDEKATSEAVAKAMTQIHDADDSNFKPDAADLDSADPSEAHTHAILEAADGMIDPDKPFSENPDDDINEAVTEGSGDSKDAFSGFAGRALTRADCGAVVAEDPELEQTPTDEELGNPEDDVHSFLEVQETRTRLFQRNRDGSLRADSFGKKATSTFIKIIKGLKYLLPQTFSAGVGGNLGPLAASIDIAFDMNSETMGVVSCTSALLGTDSIGVGVNYHIQAGWYGEKQRKAGKPKLADVWGGFTAGVTASVGFTAANVPLSVGAALGWGANGIANAWKEFKGNITEAHSKNKKIVQGTDSKAVIAMSTLKTAAKDAWVAVKALTKAALATLPNPEDTIVANVAIGTGVSAATLAVGVDVTVGYCVVPVETKSATKLWKLLLGLFLVSGPPGAVAGLFSWMAYHSDVIIAALKNLKGKLVKIGKTISTFAKVAASKIKNFWVARVVPASKESVAKFKNIVAGQKAALEKGLQKMKTVYFFPTGNMLKDLVTQAKAKLKNFLGKMGNLFKKKKF